MDKMIKNAFEAAKKAPQDKEMVKMVRGIGVYLKIDGETKYYFFDEVIANGSLKTFYDFLKKKIGRHKCYDCSKASPLRCEKFRNANLKQISEYPFIKTGYQTFIEGRKECRALCVSDCSDFSRDKKSEKCVNSVAAE